MTASVQKSKHTRGTNMIFGQNKTVCNCSANIWLWQSDKGTDGHLTRTRWKSVIFPPTETAVLAWRRRAELAPWPAATAWLHQATDTQLSGRSQCLLSLPSPATAEGSPAILMSPPCVEFQGCQFDPTFLCLLSCTPICLVLFCFWPILLTNFPLSLYFPNGWLLCVALVVF